MVCGRGIEAARCQHDEGILLCLLVGCLKRDSSMPLWNPKGTQVIGMPRYWPREWFLSLLLLLSAIIIMHDANKISFRNVFAVLRD
jgi:hypothetical protein